jgi:hypothetical protein
MQPEMTDDELREEFKKIETQRVIEDLRARNVWPYNKP